MPKSKNVKRSAQNKETRASKKRAREIEEMEYLEELLRLDEFNRFDNPDDKLEAISKNTEILLTLEYEKYKQELDEYQLGEVTGILYGFGTGEAEDNTAANTTQHAPVRKRGSLRIGR